MTDEDPTPASAQQPREDRTAWITEGSLPKAVWRLAIPMSATMFFHTALELVDTYFVGHIEDSETALAAVGAAWVLMGLIHMISIGIVTGCTAFVANAIGAGDRKRAETVAAQSLVLALGFSVVVAFIGYFFTDSILGFLGVKGQVAVEARSYLLITTIGSFTGMLAFTFGAAVRGAGDARTPLIAMAAGNILNIILDPIMIFGLWGCPEMGVAGSAWATVISRGLSMLALAWVFFVRGHEHFSLHIRDLKPHFAMLWRIVRMGVMASGQMFFRSISSLILVRIVAGYGTAALAAYTVGIRLWIVVLFLGMGFGNAAATIVGQNVGAGKPERAARGAWMSAWCYGGICLLMGIGYWLFAEELVRAFARDPGTDMLHHGVVFLRWVVPSFVLVGISITLGRAMNGAGDTLMPLIVTFISVILVRIPLAWIVSSQWGRVDGVWIGFAAGATIQGLLFMVAFKIGRWKRAIGAQGGITAAAVGD